MEAIEMIKNRRSIRKFKEEKVPHELMMDIVEAARFAPSWANFQVARYTFVDDHDKIVRLSEGGMNGFIYNISALKDAMGVAVVSYVKGKSSKLDPNEDYSNSKGAAWEVFDAGIATQTFCLAAHAKGVGTCIMGVADQENIADVIDLPDDEVVACLIVYGYPTDEEVFVTPRKAPEEIARFV